MCFSINLPPLRKLARKIPDMYLYFFVLRDADGEWFTYSFGGYHADDDERTVLEADNSGGPFFKSTPIDVHRFEMGKATACQGNSVGWLRLVFRIV